MRQMLLITDDGYERIDGNDIAWRNQERDEIFDRMSELVSEGWDIVSVAWNSRGEVISAILTRYQVFVTGA